MAETPRSSAYVATVPSNIALVKYWGKRDATLQWPANDSLSMTLSAARTITAAAVHDGPGDVLVREGHVQAATPATDDKALRHLATLRRELGGGAPLRIETRNTFPSDCGIASSASGLGALTLAAIAAWTGSDDLTRLAAAGFPRDRLAQLARRGSGSACRSFHGGFVEWLAGESPDAQRVAPVREAGSWDLADVIVLVSTARKTIGSTAAHAAAWTSPLFQPRLAGLPDRLALVRSAIQRQDLERLGEALETEALEMHAVMQSSTPPANYFLKETSALLAWVRVERRAGRLAAWFTLDAGPNPHLICAPDAAESVARRVREGFEGVELIMDKTGTGPALEKGRFS